MQMPDAPSVDELAVAYPSIKRPIYDVALSLASTRSPARQACALAVLRSLLDEGFPAKDDLRIIAARLAVALGRPCLGREALSGEAFVSAAHSESADEVGQALSQVRDRALETWPAALVCITSPIVDCLQQLDGPWLGLGATAALSVLYGPSRALFSLTVLGPEALTARFGQRIPKTLVLAEADIPAAAAAELLQSYTSLPLHTIICVSRSSELPPLSGRSGSRRTIEVPAHASLTLADPCYTDSPAFSPPLDDTGQTLALTLYTWSVRA